MKMLKLREHKAEPSAMMRRKARPVPQPADEARLPLSLIDTQTMRTLRVTVDSRQISAVPPPAVRVRAEQEPSGLALQPVETNAGYDPYNNFGGAAARRPQANVPGSRY